MGLPETLQTHSLYKRICVLSFYIYHTFCWVLMKSVIQSFSQSVSSHGSLSQLFAMNVIHDQTLCE